MRSVTHHGLVVQAECEVLDRKMAALQAEMREQAAEVHRNHKFNSGATEPTGESSPTKLASGLVGTAEVCIHSHATCLVCMLSSERVHMCLDIWLALL